MFAARGIARQFQAIVRARFDADSDRRATIGASSRMISQIPRDIVRLGRNFMLSLGGEGLQSGFHFVLNLVLIRLLSPHDFGIFAIAFVLGGISLTYGNALVSTPAAVLMPRLKSRGAVDFQDVVFGSICARDLGRHHDHRRGGLWFATGQTGGSGRGRRVRRPVDAAQSRAHA